MKETQPIRSQKALLIYLVLALYVYLLNAAGPITRYLQDELSLSYTMRSLHTSAFAAGMVLIGMFGNLLFKRMNYWLAVAIGAVGLGSGGLLLVLARSSALSLAGLFIVGTIGTFILALYPAIIDREMRQHAALGIAEANVLSSIFAALAPVAIGFFASKVVGWRLAVILVAGAAGLIGVYLFTRKDTFTPPLALDLAQEKHAEARLPRLYWVLWLAMILSVTVEFCTIYWGADYLEKVRGIAHNSATQAVSLFLIGMIIGRIVSSRLLDRLGARLVLMVSIILGLLGFLMFWAVPFPAVSIAGLLVSGLGVASLYPTNLALSIDASNGLKALAGSRSTLASGIAVLLMPLLLGVLADNLGIRPAFLIMPVAYGLLVLVLALARRMRAEA